MHTNKLFMLLYRYHMYCLSPPLTSPPEGLWSCNICNKEFHSGKWVVNRGLRREKTKSFIGNKIECNCVIDWSAAKIYCSPGWLMRFIMKSSELILFLKAIKNLNISIWWIIWFYIHYTYFTTKNFQTNSLKNIFHIKQPNGQKSLLFPFHFVSKWKKWFQIKEIFNKKWVLTSFFAKNM